MDGESGGSWRLASLWGVPLWVHRSTVGIVTGLPVAIGLLQGVDAGLRSLGVVGWALSAVLAHEYGHALLALRQGLKVDRVQLGPLINSASVQSPPGPRSELLVALGGPLANLILAACALGLDRILGRPEGLWMLGAWVHAVMGGVNLLPVFPLDGARVLRASLGLRCSWIGANRASVAVACLLVLSGSILGLHLLQPDPWTRGTMLLVAAGLLVGQASQLRRAWAREDQLQERSSPAPGDWRSLDVETFRRRRKKCDSAHAAGEELSFWE